jgi:hypothetical protein
MQRLSAGSQFEDRPMKDINRAGPSEGRIDTVRALMSDLQTNGRIGAARLAVAAVRADERPMMDSETEEEHRSEIEMAKRVATEMMSVGDVQGAVQALRAVQPWLCTVTDLGSSVLCDLAMALDACRDPEAKAIFASLSRAPSEDVRMLAKMMGSLDESEDILKL